MRITPRHGTKENHHCLLKLHRQAGSNESYHPRGDGALGRIKRRFQKLHERLLKYAMEHFDTQLTTAQSISA